MTRSLRLLILSNDAEAATKLAATLGTDGVVVYSTAEPDEACQLISLLQHDVLLIDIDKLIGTPVYPLQAFRQEKSDIKIVGISRGQRGDTGLLVGLLDLDAHMREPVTPEGLIISLPEIADRYLMVSVGDTPDQDPDQPDRRKWQPDTLPFIGGRRRPSPQA
jgi:DNA-binding NtrC family response regulator